MAVSSPDLKAFLVATPFFGGLSDASLDLLISMLVERRFDVGVTVVAEGEPGRSMYIVHSGELVVSKLSESGHAIRMTGLGPGDFFRRNDAHRNAESISHRRRGQPNRAVRAHGPKAVRLAVLCCRLERWQVAPGLSEHSRTRSFKPP